MLDMASFGSFEHLAVGDVEAWARDVEVCRSLSKHVQEPFYDYCAGTMTVAMAIMRGQFSEAESLAQGNFAAGQQLGVDSAEGAFGVQMFTLRREQGLLGELAAVVQHFVDRGEASAWRPGLALIYHDLGLAAQARIELERLASDDFGGLPRDGATRQTCLCYLAEVSAEHGDRCASVKSTSC